MLVQGQVAPGGEIELWSHQRGRIGYWTGIGLEVRLKVPSLNATEVLQARAITCDGKEAYSQEEVVQPSGELGRSLIEEPLYEGNVA